MFKKGRKRESKGLAVVYFIIGLIILLIILAVIYFALVELDYSDRIKNPDATMRSYVEMTPEPEAPKSESESEEGFEEGEVEEPLEVDLTSATPEPTPEPTPTPSPTPEPTPEPTPTPTPIPPTMLAQPRTAGFTLPAAAPATCQAGLTKCTVSVGDSNRILYLAGYGYLNEASFDGAQARIFLVVSQPKTNQLIAYQATMRTGISGVTHDGAMCKNAAASDFEVSFDVSQLYTGDIYNLGLVIGYKNNGRGRAKYVYYAFPADINFTVLDGQVVEGVRVAGEPAAMDADAGADTGINDPTLDSGIAGNDLLGNPLEQTGFEAAAPEDLSSPTPTALPQSPFITPNPADLQQQLMNTQMGVG